MPLIWLYGTPYRYHTIPYHTIPYHTIPSTISYHTRTISYHTRIISQWHSAILILMMHLQHTGTVPMCTCVPICTVPMCTYVYLCVPVPVPQVVDIRAAVATQQLAHSSAHLALGLHGIWYMVYGIWYTFSKERT